MNQHINAILAAVAVAFGGAATAQTTAGPNTYAIGAGSSATSINLNQSIGYRSSVALRIAGPLIGNDAFGTFGVTSLGSMSIGNSPAYAGDTIVGVDVIRGTPTLKNPANGNTQIGAATASSGSGNTLTGFGASGSDSSAAFGQLAAAGGNSVAIGSTSYNRESASSVNVGSGSTAVGNFATALGTQTIAGTFGSAIGYESVAHAQGSATLGAYARTTSGATNSVAIGSGSLADQAQTVSFGTSTSQRRLVNVAAGIAVTDAANVGQVRSLIASSLVPINARLGQHAAQLYDHEVRITGLEESTAAIGQATQSNTVRIEGHEVMLADHDQRINAAHARADQAYSVATRAEGKADQALAGIDALRAATGELRQQAFAGTASALAAAGSAIALNPGERKWFMAAGGYGGQTAVALGIAASNAYGHAASLRVVRDKFRTGFSASIEGKF